MSTEGSRNTGRAQLGDRARDLVTGFSGIITARTKWMSGCDRVSIEAEELGADGTPRDAQSFDETRVVVTARGVVPPGIVLGQQELELGAAVTDAVTGFTGRLSGRATLLGGFIRYGIDCNELNGMGEPIPTQWFDADRLMLVEVRPVPQSPNAATGVPGGPQRGEATLGR